MYKCECGELFSEPQEIDIGSNEGDVEICPYCGSCEIHSMPEDHENDFGIFDEVEE